MLETITGPSSAGKSGNVPPGQESKNQTASQPEESVAETSPAPAEDTAPEPAVTAPAPRVDPVPAARVAPKAVVFETAEPSAPREVDDIDADMARRWAEAASQRLVTQALVASIALPPAAVPKLDPSDVPADDDARETRATASINRVA